AIGLIACAILMVNNIRDIPTDFAAGKRTLAVRLGDRRARHWYVAMIWGALVLGLACALANGWGIVVIVLTVPAELLSIAVLAGARGRILVRVVGGAEMFELAVGILLGLGLAI